MMLHLCIQASSVVKEPWAERWPSPKGSGMIMAHYGPDIWFRYKSKDWAMGSPDGEAALKQPPVVVVCPDNGAGWAVVNPLVPHLDGDAYEMAWVPW